ncbi:hypothetical protein [Spiroplasma citri]|uniref:Hypothetical transmembrane protein n=1 Tax=Spiroplasma citri TaxID=2133 RepID=Q14NT6_SPICI|nr:hypothetical protein [Spiroplasma citri]APE75172.1 hypothetical protein SCITRI_001295 [Spiroplasma citri]QIA67425.1 hypothetical protein GMI18_07160 [Spiroplasma citri]QIA69279.1 hypothetical protein GL298_07115 [Spiroplasma citri]QIA71146.1 hypothetical protein GL981_07170 [Spiroplasma citri]QIA73219.1 hypothetical protein GL982_06125 [Spiroplasma citri]
MKKIIVIFGALGLSSSSLSGTLMKTPDLNYSNRTVEQEFIMRDIIGDISNKELAPSNVYSLLNSKAQPTLTLTNKPVKVKSNSGFKIFKKIKNFTKKAYKEVKKDAKDFGRKIGRKIVVNKNVAIEKSLGKKIIPPKDIETGLSKVEKISETGIKDIAKSNNGIKNFFTRKTNKVKKVIKRGFQSIKNIGNTAETFLKEEGKHLRTIMKGQGKNIEKIGKNTFQGMKTAGKAVKALVKEESKNLKIGIKKGAVLAYKGLKKTPRILGKVIGEFTNGLVCALFGIVPGSAWIVLGTAAVGAIGYYAYNHSDEVKNFANSVANTTKGVASSTTHFLTNWWPF